MEVSKELYYSSKKTLEDMLKYESIFSKNSNSELIKLPSLNDVLNHIFNSVHYDKNNFCRHYFSLLKGGYITLCEQRCYQENFNKYFYCKI